MTQSPVQSVGRPRLIIDNDFAGDPDGLVQLAHHLLSESVEVVAIVASHLPETYDEEIFERSAESGREKVFELLRVMGCDGQYRVLVGAESGLTDRVTPQLSDACLTIIAEAERTPLGDQLIVACGGGLTDVASALLLRPDLASRMRVIWIGGHAEQTLVVDNTSLEFNTKIDPLAVDVVFNSTEVTIWQVPFGTYAQCIVSMSELRVRMRTQGALGLHLYEQIELFIARYVNAGRAMGETFLFGDSPLVLLTSLTSNWTRTPVSSEFDCRPALSVDEEGNYRNGSDGPRKIRVYTSLDARLMVEDFYAKLSEFVSTRDPSVRRLQEVL